MRKKLASLLIAGGLLATLSMPGFFLVQKNQSTPVNFDLNTYLFTIGAGAVFDGGTTANAVNIAFNKAIFTNGQ